MAVVATYDPTGTLKPVAEGVWIVDGPVIRFGYLGLRFPFPTRMTVVRLADGQLWVHSPTELSSSLKSEINSLGSVKHLIAPNRIHYWWLGDWAKAFPGAVTYAAPGVRKQARGTDRPPLFLEDPAIELVVPEYLEGLALGVVICTGQSDNGCIAGGRRLDDFLDQPSS
jgi:hypothetical protein